MASVEVLAGPATSGGGEQKQAIVAAAFGPGAVVRRGATGRRDGEFDLSLAAGSSSRGQWVRSGVRQYAGWRWRRHTRLCRRSRSNSRATPVRIPASVSPALAAAVVEALA